ncbi:hypothetical protein MJH12_13425, partial [bacterium]|nr:hypothetical protein [bacterium]
MKMKIIPALMCMIFLSKSNAGKDGLVDHGELIKRLMQQNSKLLSLVGEIKEQETKESMILEQRKRKILSRSMHKKAEDDCHIVKVKSIEIHSKPQKNKRVQNTEKQLMDLIKKQSLRYQEVIVELEEEESRISIAAGQRYDMDQAKNSSTYVQLGYRVADKTHAIVELQKRDITDIFQGHTQSVCIGLKKYFADKKKDKITPYGAVLYSIQFADMGG